MSAYAITVLKKEQNFEEVKQIAAFSFCQNISTGYEKKMMQTGYKDMSLPLTQMLSSINHNILWNSLNCRDSV